MSTEYSEAALAEAAAAIQVSQGYRAGRGERFLNTLGMYVDILSTACVNSPCPGDKIITASDSQVASTVQNIAASAAFNIVKSEVTRFVETSKILVRALDEVGKVHPFIQGVSCSALTLYVVTYSSYRSCGFCVRGGYCPGGCSTRE